MTFRPDPKPEKKPKVKKRYIYRRKPTGETAIFAEIWSTRPHSCQVCQCPIIYPTPTTFAHILAKGQNKYPKFKLNPQNIVIMCDHHHHTWDNGIRDKIRHDHRWFKIFELEISLKEQYKKL